MNFTIRPDTSQKIDLLSNLSHLECDGEPTLSKGQLKQQQTLQKSVVQVQRADGPKTVLRTLQTSACEKNCHYCPFRAGRNNTVRVTFTPDELAAEFNKMQQAKVVDGLFLSSGIIGGGSKAMGPLLDTVDILRRKYTYRGYVHLKIMPGAEYAQIEQAMRLADRISINLEGANTNRLLHLAPQKDLKGELVQAMQWANHIAQQKPPWLKKPGLTTQFVVGPAGENDQEILKSVAWLYRHVNLSRAYYSKFSPISNTPLADFPATPAIREHRLYQADWLLRFYGFKVEELPFTENGQLPTTIDPKMAWAQQNLLHKPIELNQASQADLLRIPGIGPQHAQSILQIRKENRLTDLGHLKQIGIALNRAAPFILLNGQRPPHQLPLFNI